MIQVEWKVKDWPLRFKVQPRVLEKTAQGLGYSIGQNVLYRVFQENLQRLDRNTLAALLGATEHLSRRRLYPDDVLELVRPQQPPTEDWLARGSAFRLYSLPDTNYQIDRYHPDMGWESTYLDSEEAAVRTLRRYLRLACDGDESIEFSSRGLKLLGLNRDPDELQLPRRAH
jgi:hypothetical protein